MFGRLYCSVVCPLGISVLQGGEKFLLPQCVQDLPPQTPLRAIVDAESDHGADEGLSFRIQGYPVKEVVSGWAHTEPGKLATLPEKGRIL